MSDLAAFLTARLDEREARARAAAADHGREHWSVGGGGDYVYPDPPPGNSYVAVGPWGGGIGPAAEHIAANDPAFVLADVAAKRAIVARAVLLAEQANSMPYDNPNRASFEGQALAWGLAARLLAQPYAAHPDFDPAWKVQP